jgi:17beta-estradiol 17-dehydrogenase / very-long-chain 3-oxoacyl-CoA reductase
MNIILVSRTLTKLQTVAKEIEEAFNVDTAVIVVDFTFGPEIYDKIKREIAGKEIGVLVNNVGILAEKSYPDFLSYPDLDNYIRNVIRCNMTSMPMMCSLILPQMVQRKKGIVINIASITALVSRPGWSIYSASKAFVHKFSKELNIEYRRQGIIIQTVLPGSVATNLIKLKTGAFDFPSAADFVAGAIRTVGFADETTGYWVHSVQVVLLNVATFLLPSSVFKVREIHTKRLDELIAREKNQ